MSTNFAITTSTPYTNVIQSINYALANMTSANVQLGGNILIANTTTGTVTGGGAGTISYLYGYMDVQYANTSTGGGFTSNSNNTQYYGIRNVSTPTEDSNPTDYAWTQVVGGFGTTKGLYYATGGGGTISFVVGTTTPNQYYTPVIDNTPILLAEITANLVTGNSIQSNTITGNNIQTRTITGNNINTGTLTGNLIAANTIVGTNIVAQTITGNLIAAGTLTANLVAANAIFVNQSIQSANATFGDNTSVGFWLASNTGNARFGGNTSIGNNLTVGNNAVIGGNLTVGNNAVIGGNLIVSGLITAGALNANTVSTNNIAANAISSGTAGTSSTAITITYPTSGVLYFYTYANTTVTVSGTDNVYINGVLATDTTFVNSDADASWFMTFYLYRDNGPIGSNRLAAYNYRYDVPNSVSGARYNNIVPFTYLDYPSTGTYTYSMAVSVEGSLNPALSIPDMILSSGTLVAQVLKK